MARIDLYTHVHKALRALFFEAAERLGRTDFSRAQELPELAAALRLALRLGGLHAQHEDRDIHPLLHRLAPELAADLEAGHDRFDGLERELEHCLSRLDGAEISVRVSIGRRIQELFLGLIADHLVHMAQEESRANRVLWANLSDSELAQVHGRILAAIPQDELALWIPWMFTAGNLSERALLLAGLRAALPADAFAASTAPARALLGEQGWGAALEEARRLEPSAGLPTGATA